VFYDAFMIQKDSIEGYNQIKGRQLFGLFEDNEIYEVDIVKNAETIFYTRDDQGELVGINKSMAARIKLFLENQEVTDFIYYKSIDSKTYPKSLFPENAAKLKDFNWRGDERLLQKSDLFRGRDSLVLPKIKGIELPEADQSFFQDLDKMNSNSGLKTSDLQSRSESEDPAEDSPKRRQKLKAKPVDEE